MTGQEKTARVRLTFGEKAELDALVNFFGGKSMLLLSWMNDPKHKSMCRKGVTRWGRRSGGMVEHIATKKGVAVAKRFKRDWSQLWADANPMEPE